MRLGGDAVLVAWERWAAEIRADEAARSRARERWLRLQSAEGTRFAALVVDLAERAQLVVLHMADGGRRRGVILALGADFVALRTEQSRASLVRLERITAVRAPTSGPPLSSDRPIEVELDLSEALRALADDRPRLVLSTGGEQVAGELHAIGEDVLTLRLDAEDAPYLYVRLAALTEVTVD